QRPHTLRIHLQSLDVPASQIQTQSAPANAGTKHLASDDRLVPSDRRNKISSDPKVPPYEPSMGARHKPEPNGLHFCFDVPHDLTNRVLRRNRQHHVNMVGQPFFNPALPVFCKLAEHLSQMLAPSAIENSA